MASIYKKSRWVNAQGKACRRGDDGATLKKSRTWFIQILDGGKRQTIKGYSDRDATQQLAAKLERRLARGEGGLVDPYERHAKRPLSEHVADWTSELASKYRSSKYVYNVSCRIDRLAHDCGWIKLADITGDSVGQWLSAPQTVTKGTSYDTMGPRTINQYLEAIGAFCRWCVKRKRMRTDPTAGIEKAKESLDIRRQRRALSADELRRLLEVAPDHYRLGYRMLMETGLRRSELTALRWGDIRLNAPHPFIQLRAEATKAGRADVLPLRADLVDLLRVQRGNAGDDDRPVPTLPTIASHRKYLDAAGIPWMDDAGRRADLHALRHSYGTLLAQAGVGIREAMELMRHTDMRLTTKVYTDPKAFNLAGAVEKLPSFTPDESHAKRATGTAGVDDNPNTPRTYALQNSQQSIGLLGHSLASNGKVSQRDEQNVSGDYGMTWQQKTPPDKGGAIVRRVGIEPTT